MAWTSCDFCFSHYLLHMYWTNWRWWHWCRSSIICVQSYSAKNLEKSNTIRLATILRHTSDGRFYKKSESWLIYRGVIEHRHMARASAVIVTMNRWENYNFGGINSLFTVITLVPRPFALPLKLPLEDDDGRSAVFCRRSLKCF